MLNSLSNNCPYKEGKETTNYSSDILQEIKSPLSEIISPSTKYLDNETHLQIVGAETIKEIRKKVFKYFSELIGIPLSNEPWRDEVINYQPRAFSQLFGVGREQTNEEVNEYTFLDLIPRNDRGALYKQLESLGLKKGYLRKSEVSGEEILE
ncbi:MAG: hypothetical protein LBD11_03780 [Candidatus Peribacteria bacterium]|jgi:hypothetical protein|nr:hypothetical protein [Candidatus Peribacteria bacterium]